MSSPVVTDHPESERYELHLGDELAGILEYRGGGELRALTHTEIFEGHEGEGLGGQLIKAVLDDLRERGLQITPICPFVVHYLREHPQYVDLVKPSLRAAFGLI